MGGKFMRKILCATVVVTATAGSANAQDNLSADKDRRLGAVVVTATGRETSLQDVPLSVTAFDDKALKLSGIEDARQLMALAPSLTLNVTTSDSAGVVIRLRGIGSEAINAGLESSVGTYVDGVYRARSNLSLSSLPGIDRIEVLRGPQGTLFGKNTSVGVLNVVTKSPEFDPSVEIVGTIGNYDYRQVSAALTGPIVGDKLAGRVDAVITQRDGWIEDIDSDRTFRNKDVYTLRTQLLWQANPDLKARLILDHSYYDQSGPDTYVPTYYDPETLSLLQDVFQVPTGLGLDSLTNTISEDRDSREMNTQHGASLQVDWDIGDITATSVSSYRMWRNKQGREVDYSEIDLAYIDFGGAHQYFETASQEFRLTGESGPVDWLAGLYYAREDIDARYGYRIGNDLGDWFDARFGTDTFAALLPGGFGSNTQFNQTTTSYSAFTHNIIALNDRTNLTLGGRYTVDEKEVDAIWSLGNPGCTDDLTGLARSLACLQLWDPRYTEAARGGPTYSTGNTEREFSGVASMDYALTDTINLYATAGRGYKAGGFALDPAGFDPISSETPNPDPQALAFEPEFSNHFELGAKTQFFDRRLTINAAAFHTELENFQLSYNTGAALPTVNIPQVTTTGAEFELSARPIESVSSTFNVVYANAHYGDIDPELGLPANILALNQRRLYNAPLWTVTGSLGWDDLVFDGRFRAFAYADARYQSSAFTERSLRANSEQDAYATVNARIGIQPPDEAWSIELWSRNLTDERYLVSTIAATFTAASNVGVPGEPRLYGVTFRRNW
jgi:outer membrane receptor protein involved in Fe transport